MTEINNISIPEIPFHEVPKGLLVNWSMASWLAPADSVQARLSSSGFTGVTRDELKAVENLSTRRTNTDADPPIVLSYERPDKTDSAIFRMMRHSNTLGRSEQILEVRGGIKGAGLEIHSPKNSQEVIKVVSPVLDKVGDNVAQIAAHVCERAKEPNKMLMRTSFATNIPDAYWIQFDSPVNVLPIETDDFPLYRLYFNPNIQSVHQFGNLAGSVIRAARGYSSDGLHFKMMYGGEGAKKVIMDPVATKLVFYFSEKQGANQFGDYFGEICKTDPTLSLVTAGKKYMDQFVTQKVWNDGLILLGKGTRELRRDIIHRLPQVNLSDLERQRLMDRADKLSIVYNR